MQTSSPSRAGATTGGSIATYCIVAGSSILFCSKGVIAKLAYVHGADSVAVVTLRMAFALPFFAGMAFFVRATQGG